MAKLDVVSEPSIDLSQLAAINWSNMHLFMRSEPLLGIGTSRSAQLVR